MFATMKRSGVTNNINGFILSKFHDRGTRASRSDAEVKQLNGAQPSLKE